MRMMGRMTNTGNSTERVNDKFSLSDNKSNSVSKTRNKLNETGYNINVLSNRLKQKKVTSYDNVDNSLSTILEETMGNTLNIQFK